MTTSKRTKAFMPMTTNMKAAGKEATVLLYNRLYKGPPINGINACNYITLSVTEYLLSCSILIVYLKETNNGEYTSNFICMDNF